MSNPKRKVTDLLPSEAILIRSDADLKVLEEFEKVGIVWHSSRRKPTEYYPKQFPFYVRYDLSFDGIVLKFYPTDYKIVPATDFIPTESDEVEVDDYWKTRCELAEAIIEACPCDPDITTEQIEAWKNYHEFIKTRNTPNQ